MSLKHRRKIEAKAIQELEEAFPNLVSYAPEKVKKSKTMQAYITYPIGKAPLKLSRKNVQRKILAGRTSTSTERYRAARGLPVFAKAKLKSGPRPIGHKAMTRQAINKRY